MWGVVTSHVPGQGGQGGHKLTGSHKSIRDKKKKKKGIYSELSPRVVVGGGSMEIPTNVC